jgi:hypothetical protein
MLDYEQMLYHIEVHSVTGIKKYFEEGGNPNEEHQGVPLFTTMVEMYTRTPRFKDCIRAFVKAGLHYPEKALLYVLMDDVEKLKEVIKQDPAIVFSSYSVFKNTYTPLTGGSLLHFCAEYNAVNCAKLLVQHGADINAKAGLDEYGFGGHTPVFHTVNQNNNNSSEMLHFLLENSANLDLTVRGLIWGKGFEWETWIPAVNPISYCLMGLLPQMHRDELTISKTLTVLTKYAYGIDYKPSNIPCAYLRK